MIFLKQSLKCKLIILFILCYKTVIVTFFYYCASSKTCVLVPNLHLCISTRKYLKSCEFKLIGHSNYLIFILGELVIGCVLLIVLKNFVSNCYILKNLLNVISNFKNLILKNVLHITVSVSICVYIKCMHVFKVCGSIYLIPRFINVEANYLHSCISN